MSNHEKASNLYVKSFFAASIPAAMEQAQQELGSEALLLNAREAPAEARHLGDFEVVFGASRETLAPAPAPATVAAPPQADAAAMSRPLSGSEPHPAEVRRPARRRPAARMPAHAGADTIRARYVERRARKRIATGSVLNFAKRQEEPAAGPPSPPTPEELSGRFEVKPEIGRITVLVGPPGSGKTTTLVKLAVNECLKVGRAVRFISADTVRIGGAYQLRTYATILGVPFQAVESAAALGQAIDSAPADTFLLIDTPGFSAALQEELGAELAMLLRHRQDIDTHLVLTASMAQAELRNTTDRFAAFNPGKLIFTHVDETTSTAAVFSEAARTLRPVSFLCNGQSVPEDILPASKDSIISSLVRQLPDSLQAVA